MVLKGKDKDEKPFSNEKDVEILHELVAEVLSEVQLIMNLWDNQDIRGAVIMLHKLQATMNDFTKQLPEIESEKQLELIKRAYDKVGYVYEEKK